MLAIAAVALGFGAYQLVSINERKIAEQESRYQEVIQMASHSGADYQTPLYEVDISQAGDPVPLADLPADARPTPGYTPQQGAVQRKIIYKSNPGVPKENFSIIVEKTGEKVRSTGDPIWKVALVDGSGKEVEAVNALSGRASKQTANRHQSGNKSPLPGGVYAIDRHGIDRGPFSDPELGSGYWIPITPLFQTGRSALGFHQDPSWGKANGESGTSGCIGLESPEATAKLVGWIKTYGINKVIVIS